MRRRTTILGLAAGAAVLLLAGPWSAGGSQIRDLAGPAAPRIVVHSGKQLARALARTTRTTIVLADGTYDRPTPFRVVRAHRLVAQNTHRAVLRAGLVVGANTGDGGARIEGLVLDVRSTARTLDGASLHVWGPAGARTTVVDCVFKGHDTLAFGLLARNPSGLVAERLRFTGFTDVALRASDGIVVPYGAATPRIRSIADIVVDGVGRTVPGSSNGTAEAGLWIGHPVELGVHRITVRNVSWAGIETVNNAWDTTFSELDIDMSGPRAAAAVGIYLEHHNHRNVFERFRIRGATIGVVGEWADPAWGGIAGSHNTILRDGVVDAAGSTAPKTWGIYLDEGTESTTITRVAFRNQSFAAIGAYRTTGANLFTDNDTSGLLATALGLSTAHWSSATP